MKIGRIGYYVSDVGPESESTPIRGYVHRLLLKRSPGENLRKKCNRRISTVFIRLGSLLLNVASNESDRA